MANTVFKLRRSSVAGKKPTTSDIAIGEQALNLTDRILYSSDGTNIWEIGANNTTVNVSNSITVATNSITNSSGIFTTTVNAASYKVGTSAFVANTSGVYTNNDINLTNNDKGIKFTPLAGGSNVVFIQQSDDNFVFYSTNTTNGQRAIFNVYANTNSNVQLGAFKLNVPLDMSSQALYANGSSGTAGQVLTSNGSALYWTSVGGTGTVTSVSTGTGLTGGPITGTGTISVNTAYNFTWTNNHTFSANVSVTGSGIAVSSNTGSVYFGGISDANWRISRNAGITTKFFYTNNSLDIIAASSPNEGIVFGWTGNSYLEVGYAGTYTTLPIYVGNSSVNTTINSTSFTGTSNNSNYLGGTAAASYVQNTDSRTLSGNLTLSGANLVVSGTNTYITSNTIIGSSVTSTFYSINGQVNAASGNFIANAYATLGGYGGNYLAFGQQTNFAQWIQSGYSSASPVYYSIILNPLGGNVGIGNTAPTDKLSVNGTTYLDGNVTIGSSGLSANGSYGTAGQSLLSNGSATYWATAGATLNANNTDTQTFYIGLSNASTGAWTNAVVSTSKLYFVPDTGTLTVGSSTVNSTNYTGTANNTLYVGSVTADNVVSNAQLSGNLSNYQTTAGLASNVATLAANSATYLGNSSGTITNIDSWITSNASAAYTNAVSYVDGKSYVNTSQLSSNLSNYLLLTGGTVTGNIVANNANTTYDLNVGRNLTVAGNLTITGNVTVIGANTLSIVDNMFYLNSNNTTQNIDLGFVGNYNDGTYHHAGFFRDASDGIWKVFDNYEPEPDAAVNIDTTNTTFHVANFQANSFYAGNTSTNWFVVNTAGAYHTGLVNASAFTTTGNANATSFNAGANVSLDSTDLIFVGNTTTSPTITLANTGSFTIGNSTTTQTGSIITVANSTGNVQITPGTTSIVAGGSISGANLTATTNVATFGTTSYFVANGNVGIGTSSPAYKLTVTSNVGNEVGLFEATTNNCTMVLKSSSGFGSYISLCSNGNAAFANSLDIYQTETGLGIIGNKNGDLDIQAGTGGTAVSRMYISASNGNVGIGNSSPAATLVVQGTVDMSLANVVQQTLTDGASIAWDASLGQIATVTLAGNRALANPTNLKVGTYILHVLQDAVGGRTLSYGSVYKFPAGVAPVLTTTASARDVLSFVCDGTNMYGSYLPDVK